ncbi:hypothetical protein BXZ70DRAFT_937606 [Cristinia sonorae]|uniref:Uncharacterized protein n=1 Tax=Cristinia sonorae TaxID=1940300 RepID=A0A8K0UNG9_9AGAR|nr:hypothetical protein BXZ70DRAFT_937606 [Cristinia sonorae]
MSVQNTAPTEVDDFLAPMEMLFVDPPPQPKEIPRAALGPLALPRIQRKWKWEGELHVQSDKDQSRMLCKVALNEASDPRKCGLPFKLCIGEQKSILLRKMHDISDLMLVLPACAAFTQACKVGPQEAADSDVLKTLEKFMRKKRMFTYAPALLDGDPTGLIIVFPSAFDDLSDLFQLPPNLRAPDGLVAVLCPWMLPIGDFEKYDWVSKENLLQPEKSLLDPGYAGIMRSATRKQVLDNPLYQRGLRILKFPKYLHDFMSKPNRPYCLWYGQATGSGQPPTPPDYETACLQAILNHCGATNVGLKKDVKAVFLHVGMLPTMWKVGAMSARRSKRPELRFFTYGTHETVHPSRWGLKEVWPIGGVVTFTMKAVTENLFDVCRLVDRVNRHPLWTCFIPPVVVGAVAKATSKGSDPLVLFDRNEGFCAPLLSLIEDGKLSLLTAPPLRRQPREIGTGKGWADLRTAWISGQFSLISMKSRSILDACLRSFDALHGKTPESEIASAVAQNAMKEMDSMQFQPVIMDEYRRFVVVKGATEKVHDDDREILEVVSCSSFDFKDDYFESSKK